MFVLGNFVAAIAEVLGVILSAYMWIVFARAVISWVNPDPYNPVVQFLYKITEPVLYRIRVWFKFHRAGIDLSPMVLFLAILFLQRFLVTTLQQIASRLH